MHRHHWRHGEAGRGFVHKGHGFGGHRHGWGRGGWRGRGRMFDQGDLRLIVLTLIREKPRHGYELIKAIEESLGGAYAPSPGVVYPTLQHLEELGHVALASEEGGKKLYEITAEGRVFLEENKDATDAMQRRLDRAKERFGAGPPAPIVRAMENLRMALRMRIDRGDLSEERVAEIAAALDRAAAEVEKK
ncbi:MAG: PadR family transcriptional regulator [Hyphomonadaceae bacterium]